jgi:hypothetical protein
MITNKNRTCNLRRLFYMQFICIVVVLSLAFTACVQRDFNDSRDAAKEAGKDAQRDAERTARDAGKDVQREGNFGCARAGISEKL